MIGRITVFNEWTFQIYELLLLKYEKDLQRQGCRIQIVRLSSRVNFLWSEIFIWEWKAMGLQLERKHS